MADIARPIEEFGSLVQPLVGLTVSLPWKGYGSAIFLELGRLAPLKSPRQHHRQGEACIVLEWDWRVEAAAKILYGSSNSRPEIETGIASLQNTIIQDISVFGKVPEIMVQFSNGHCLRSMAMVTGDPEWSLKLLDGKWAYSKAGSLLVGTGGSGLTDEERAVAALAERTAKRWGVPVSEPKRGSCLDCQSFVPIDGEFYLLDYGVCVAEGGPFDGRIINRGSGCPYFKCEKS